MPLPISQFGYTQNGLQISFINLSMNLNTTSTFTWDFGDGNFSDLENPIHDYQEQAVYEVTLTVTNQDGENMSMNLLNLTPQPIPTILTDIRKMVDLYAPSFIIGTIKNHNQKDFLIAKWQEYLQPLVDIPNEVSYEDRYNSAAYPVLVNSLIAKLVVIDIIMMDSSAFLLNIANEGQGSSSGSIGTGVKTEGGIKSIETGPTKVERYENKDASSLSEKITNLGRAYQQLIRPGGLLDEMKLTVCMESQRVNIYLPFCGPLPNKVFPIRIAKEHKSGHNANPFGITQRML